MKANATVSVRRNAVQNKKARTTGKARTKKHTGSPLPQASADLPEQKIDREALYSLLTRLEFDQFIRKLGLTEGEQAAAPRLPALERCTIASAFEAFGLVDSLTEADRVFVLAGKTLGALCLLSGDTAYFLYADDMGDAWNDVLARLFDGSVNLALHDAKDIIKNLLLRGLDPRGITFDTALAAYLIDPAQSSYDLPRLALACVVGAAVYAVCIIASGEGREEVQAVLRRIRK